MYLLHEFDKVVSPGFFSLSVALLSPFSSPFIFFPSSFLLVRLPFSFLFSRRRAYAPPRETPFLIFFVRFFSALLLASVFSPSLPLGFSLACFTGAQARGR